MTIDEMKNKISMELKSPVTQQGFEIICKNLADLEKENKTVSRKANEAIADKLLITAKYNEILNNLNQENYKIQRENADLKRDKEDLIFIRNQNAKYMCEDKERLTKARALLEQWLQTTHAGACDNVNLAAETEQFLAGDL